MTEYSEIIESSDWMKSVALVKKQRKSEMTEYNGWKNKATWNVSLWINNDPAWYERARGFMVDYTGNHPYIAFLKEYGMTTERTPDNFQWRSQSLDYKALNEMMKEL